MIFQFILQVALLYRRPLINLLNSNSNFYPYNCKLKNCIFEFQTQIPVQLGSAYSNIEIEFIVFQSCQGADGGCMTIYSNYTKMSRICSFNASAENAPTFGELSSNSFFKFKFVLISGSNQYLSEPPNGILFLHAENVTVKYTNFTDNVQIYSSTLNHNGYSQYQYKFLIFHSEYLVKEDDVDSSVCSWDSYHHSEIFGYLQYGAFVNNSATSVLLGNSDMIEDSYISDCTFLRNNVKNIFNFASMECSILILNCVYDDTPLFDPEKGTCVLAVNRTLTSYFEDKGVTCFFDTEVIGFRNETLCDLTEISVVGPPSYDQYSYQQSDAFHTVDPPKKHFGLFILIVFSIIIASFVISMLLYSMNLEKSKPIYNRPLPRALQKKSQV